MTDTLNIQLLADQLAATQRKMEIVRSVSFELNKLVTLSEKLYTILEILHHQFNITNSMILVPTAVGEQLCVVASYGYAESQEGKVVAFGQGIVGLAAARRRHINLTGIRRKRQYMAAVSGDYASTPAAILGLPDAESQVAIPLQSNDELVAVLMAESRDFCVFTKDDENFLITLAQPLAVSIQNSMLYDSMEEKIAARTAELQRLSETKNKFFSIISHDLRGPVTSFQSLTRLFSHYHQQGETDKIEWLCSTVDRSADNLNHLLENLLDWSLSQTDGIAYVFERVELPCFFDQVTALYRDNMAAKNLQLEKDIPENLSVCADLHTLATAFRNLVSNAIKFTPRGGTIRLTASCEDGRVVIRLHDSGVGIDAARHCSLFELKTQRTTAGTEKERGSGLGLVLVKEFVELNRGNITVTSEAGKGTCFTISFPSPQ